MGHHRPLPYSGLHFSKKAPKPGVPFSALVIFGSLLIALVFLAAAYAAMFSIGLPVRVTADGTPLHLSLLSMIKTLWS